MSQQTLEVTTEPGLARAGAAGRLRRLALGTAGAFLVWLLLVGSLAPAELGVGLILSLGVAWLSLPHLHLLDGIRLSPRLPLQVLVYLGDFSIALVAANLDMARRVLSPALPIHPGIVHVRTRLQSPLGRLLLANSITLTPGTLSVDVCGDELCVHWIDISPGTDIDRTTRAIVERFERRLTGFLH